MFAVALLVASLALLSVFLTLALISTRTDRQDYREIMLELKQKLDDALRAYRLAREQHLHDRLVLLLRGAGLAEGMPLPPDVERSRCRVLAEWNRDTEIVIKNIYEGERDAQKDSQAQQAAPAA
jgi:hypothetical protein